MCQTGLQSFYIQKYYATKVQLHSFKYINVEISIHEAPEDPEVSFIKGHLKRWVSKILVMSVPSHIPQPPEDIPCFDGDQ